MLSLSEKKEGKMWSGSQEWTENIENDTFRVQHIIEGMRKEIEADGKIEEESEWYKWA